VLSRAWQHYQLDLATHNPEQHPFVQVAAALSAASQNGAIRLLLEFPADWQALVAWIEQLMEESLGKGGKGIVVFKETPQHSQAACFQAADTLHVRITTEHIPLSQEQHLFTFPQPYLASEEPQERLAALAANFLGWQLTMALYGYLHNITFAGQPAVENYKARARTLRSLPDPLQAASDWPATFREGALTLCAPARFAQAQVAGPARIFAQALHEVFQQQGQAAGYLDLTLNGEVPPELEQVIFSHLHALGNRLLRVPVKPRHAPADYHSTEQSEMDGPPYLLSLRLLFREHEAPLVGTYTDAFLRAQAVSTWQAMLSAGRPCFLLIVDGKAAQTSEPLEQFFTQVEQLLA
ncbi:MAG: hypothetical protein IMW89_21380, partial [Ktedonobacteraceae bacterium]|nr:hypothetical protein [Ktedonobacteraceae bacterium]